MVNSIFNLCTITNKKPYISHRFQPACILLVLFGFACCVSPLANAQLNATVNKTQLQVGEVLSLIISLEAQNKGSLDLSPLQQNFQVLNQSQSSQIRIFNGQRSHLTQWTIGLLPLSTGTLTIPSLSMAGYKTQKLTINVADSSISPHSNATPNNTQPNPAKQQSLYAKAEVDTRTPYIHQEILLTVSLYFQPGIKISPPKIDIPNTKVTLIDQYNQYRSSLNGQNYQVIELYYVLNPQKTGLITIPSLTIIGEIQNRSRLFSFSFNQANPQSLYDRTQAIELQIKAIPTEFPSSQAWLPAKSITFEEHWKDETNQLMVGEALTRQLTFTIEGQSAHSIPDLDNIELATGKVYTQTPFNEDKKNQQGTTGKRTVTLAIVPTMAGDIEIPDQTLFWWNTEQDQLEKLIIPGKNISIKESDNSLTNTPIQTPMSTSKLQTVQPLATEPLTPNTAKTTALKTQTFDSNQTEIPYQNPAVWPILAGIFATLWVISSGLLVWVWQRTNTYPNNADQNTFAIEKQKKPLTRTNYAFNELKTAIENNHSTNISHSLLNWANDHFQPAQPFQSLGALHNYLGDCNLGEWVKTLEAHYFRPESKTKPDWHTLMPLINHYKTLNKKTSLIKESKKAKHKQKPILLRKLYPSQIEQK